MTLSGHTEAVSCVLWMSDDMICSAGWDHSIRLWDLKAEVNKETMVCYYLSLKKFGIACVKICCHHLLYHNIYN